MHNVWTVFRYISDPHTAVGIHAGKAYRKGGLRTIARPGVATAHPAKFAEIVPKGIWHCPAAPFRA